ncbi:MULTISPECIES: helix-turn-helix domain-containing protein [Nocardiopsidaceae]|jgi:transcriptional regulator with XRE-family HTH domain|uniref:Helix-turn-helix transcriptional regulator n=1 Tax=Streptomonospora nanhaiensis TaxID=1323731 RepID=A0ABY6YG69_9ACTN|nr:helix-turn-helix transcriptional regulator [Streptomonospora nanhaiensis]WAE71257.1 helix-turn-helix transcriptional regulator [Streptomonospora nanhaiensis]
MTEQIRPEVVVLLGNRIRAVRQGKDLSVVKLAELSGVSRRMLTQIELGQANPSIATVDRIASALGTTFPALAGVLGEGPPEGVEVWSTPNGSWASLLQAVQTSQVFVEMWKWHLVGGDRYHVSPAAGAPETMAHVLQGQLLVRSGSSDLRVDAGGSARIGNTADHTFEAGTDVAVFLGVVTMPRL